MIKKYYDGSTLSDMSDELWSIVVPSGTTDTILYNKASGAPVGSIAYTDDGSKEWTKAPNGQWSERVSDIQIQTSRIVAKRELSSNEPLTAPSGTVWTSVNLSGIAKQVPHKITSSDVNKYVVGHDFAIQNSAT